MKINDIYINADIYQVLDTFFFELKTSGSELFSKGYKESSEYLMVQCPYHKYGLEKKPSAQFRKSDGLFYCFACKETHSLDSVISKCLNTNGRAWLLDHFDSEVARDSKTMFNIGKKTVSKQNQYVNKDILEKFRFTHPYMFKRHLNLDTIRKFDVGFDKEHNCITFPNKDENGNILFIATRSIDRKYFHYPANVDKPIYGLYEIYREIRHGTQIDSVYICESMFNCLTVWSYGKYAVALNGTGSKNQIEALRKCKIRHFILALDPDEAGRHGTEKLLKGLNNKFIEVAVLPEGKDVNDLTKEEFDNLPIKNIISTKNGTI